MMERRFYLRGRETRLFGPGSLALYALTLAFVSGNAALMLIMYDTGDRVVVGAVVAMLCGIPLGAISLAYRAHRMKNAGVELTDEAIIVRGWSRATFRASTANLARLTEVEFDRADLVRWTWPLWNMILVQVPRFSGTALRIDLKRPIMHPWWALLRYRAIVIDPEDRAGFIAALRQLAPHVAMEPSALEQ